MFLINFLTSPFVCNTAFSAWDCEIFTIDGAEYSYLKEDYTVQCRRESHGQLLSEWEVIEAWSCAAILFHAFLIPVCFLALLISQRRSLYEGKPTDLARALAVLYRPYAPESFFFEFVETANKVLLVGLARVIEPGTSLQLALAVSVALTKLTVVAIRHPYRKATDNLLASCTSFMLVMFLVLAFRCAVPSRCSLFLVDTQW